MIRTRFAPSPTGFLHIGGARTALFAWAFAKKHHGKFILRIEDTDTLRSTQESVNSILDAMHWLNLTYDEGPFFQTERMDRYKIKIDELLAKGHAYYCYCTKEELDAMREEQISKGLKPKYDRRCLHKPKTDSVISPVVRFKNPDSGNVMWHDLVKGKISINNEELDDLIIARSDKTPTYNLCVVVDDMDMGITHVIRGDDHVNNTPRQINIFKAFGYELPIFAHIPMILNESGNKMSKRTDAVSVIEYKDKGILPEALLNYLARLCFGHGNDEIFSLKQFIEWFDFKHVSQSAARFDFKKLLWVNAEHIKNTINFELKQLINDKLYQHFDKNSIDLLKLIDLIKLRVDNLNDLVLECNYYLNPKSFSEEIYQQYFDSDTQHMLDQVALSLQDIQWTLEEIELFIKNFCKNNNIKMPKLAMPLRLKLCGITNTPNIAQVIFVLGRDEVLKRIRVKHAL